MKGKKENRHDDPTGCKKTWCAAQQAWLKEEIERIQDLLRRLDKSLADQDEISLKELATAVHTAGDGGKSIAQLRKFAKELGVAETDEEYQKARAGMFDMLEKLGTWKPEEEE